MFPFQALTFMSPWLLIGLLALPVLWWLMRAVPPAAVRRSFPAVTLLLGLRDEESTPDRTPWWLMLLRMLALAAAIIGFAQPVLNPGAAKIASKPLLILADASWASAGDWAARQDRIAAVLTDARASGRRVAVLSLTDQSARTGPLPFGTAGDWKAALAALKPSPWEPDYAAVTSWISSQKSAFDTLWLSDGLARKGRDGLARLLMARGNLTVVQGRNALMALARPRFQDRKITVTALRRDTGQGQEIRVNAIGPDPAGIERRVATASATFGPGERSVTVSFDLPTDLGNRIRRFEIAGLRTAGAVALADDALKRRKVALFAGTAPREGQELLSPLHYLRKALQTGAVVIEAPLRTSLLAAPDVVIMADVARIAPAERDALAAWVRKGGTLLRFAGPRMAAARMRPGADDPLLPVRLRPGGRDVGGAMSWGSPRHLRPFGKESPFFGLTIPDDVTVTSQVVAQPGPQLAARTIASLQDGTPLVTWKEMGKGRVVLFHVTANAEWSSLPLSGLFVRMLERLAILRRASTPTPADMAGQMWRPERVMDGFGTLRKADDLAAVSGEALAEGRVGPDLLPGTYRLGPRQFALNVIRPDRVLKAATWPAGVAVAALSGAERKSLAGWFLALALLLLALDIPATLLVGGRLSGPRGTLAAIFLLVLLVPHPPAQAQGAGGDGDARAIRATRDTVLAYVITGDARIDAKSEAGLYGLSRVLTRRSAVEPADPIGVDVEKDELAFFPLLYWPVTETSPIPSDSAITRINTYLQTGGMIVFDTQDADIAGINGVSPASRRLQQIAASLDIPALEPVPPDHVLTRSFYLLQSFPGRFSQGQVWVEAAPPDAVKLEGMPFRNLNDGVSPVVIGANDWAAAWAVGRDGGYLYPVGRGGYAGERQREMAYRFGVNLVMYVLTGNYKSDQVHVPALLERLGQ